LEEWYNFVTQIGHRPSEHGDITLGRMKIIPPRDGVPSDRPMVRSWDYAGTAVDLPDSPMPENIKNFDSIILTFVFFLNNKKS
jgi:hypothetical protein